MVTDYNFVIDLATLEYVFNPQYQQDVHFVYMTPPCLILILCPVYGETSWLLEMISLVNEKVRPSSDTIFFCTFHILCTYYMRCYPIDSIFSIQTPYWMSSIVRYPWLTAVKSGKSTVSFLYTPTRDKLCTSYQVSIGPEWHLLVSSCLLLCVCMCDPHLHSRCVHVYISDCVCVCL